ncbi:MAG: ABC transporter permease [Chloroflexi bacterium]|nr:ABC transporter permease [Chloroflexota bacterium]
MSIQKTPALTTRATHTTLTRRVIFFAAILIVWELVARSGIWESYLFPGPLVVGRTLIDGIVEGEYLHAALISLQRIVIGYGISLVLGMSIGALIARNSILEDTIGSLVVGLQALPSVCWLPLAILWLGLSERAIQFVIVMGALFSIILGVRDGIRNTPPIFVKAARNLGATGFTLYVQVIIPAALPSIVAGLKQGWAFAWRSLMAAELLFFSLSLGNLLQTGRDFNDAAGVMAVMMLIIAVGVTVNQLIFAPIERRIGERWGYAAASN